MNPLLLNISSDVSVLVRFHNLKLDLNLSNYLQSYSQAYKLYFFTIYIIYTIWRYIFSFSIIQSITTSFYLISSVGVYMCLVYAAHLCLCFEAVFLTKLMLGLQHVLQKSFYLTRFCNCILWVVNRFINWIKWSLFCKLLLVLVLKLFLLSQDMSFMFGWYLWNNFLYFLTNSWQLLYTHLFLMS